MSTKDAWKPSGYLPPPYLDAKDMTPANIADYRRIKAAGHATYVRQIADGTYEMIDGGPVNDGRAKCG